MSNKSLEYNYKAELQVNIESILDEKMIRDFVYSTNDIFNLFLNKSLPNIFVLKPTQILFRACLNDVIDHIKKSGKHFWYIGKPLLREPKMCHNCLDYIYDRQHLLRCDY